MCVAGRGHDQAAHAGYRSDNEAAVWCERRETAEDLAYLGLGDLRCEGGEVARESGEDIPVWWYGQGLPDGHGARVEAQRVRFPAPAQDSLPLGPGVDTQVRDA